ncbi:MAG: DNA-deoxyinosine glycosylase [Tissierellales bacterium]|nr:DNA-deoxyinosine glycosylase [Tissierellales bacterium]
MIESFEPIASKDSKILILGSMPSVISLNRYQYYGNKQNAFWKIIFELFDETLVDDYEKKKSMLMDNHIALWDVIRICERDGSSDSNIKNEEINDFETFFKEHSKIIAVFFNGKKAEEVFLKKVKGKANIPTNMVYKALPSTSPANVMKYENKKREWEIILKFL